MSEVGENGLVMSTCKCRENEKNIVATRTWLNEQLILKTQAGRKSAIKDVLELLETHRALWFSQSLNIGSGAFWSNKAATTQALITEIRKLNV